jgi:hypothetical protein
MSIYRAAAPADARRVGVSIADGAEDLPSVRPWFAIPPKRRRPAAGHGLPQGLKIPTPDEPGIDPILFISEAVAMDVVLTPTGTAGNAWRLNDRLGRTLGEITKSDHSDVFVIMPHPEGTLRTVKSIHASLDEAMSAIAKVTNGACTLDSQDWVSRGSAPRSS